MIKVTRVNYTEIMTKKKNKQLNLVDVKFRHFMKTACCAEILALEGASLDFSKAGVLIEADYEKVDKPQMIKRYYMIFVTSRKAFEVTIDNSGLPARLSGI